MSNASRLSTRNSMALACMIFTSAALVLTVGCNSWDDAKASIKGAGNEADTIQFSKGVFVGFINSGAELVETAKATGEKAKKITELAGEQVAEIRKQGVAETAKKLWGATEGWAKSAKEEGKKLVDAALDSPVIVNAAKALEEVDLEKLQAAAATIQKIGAQLPGLAKQIAALMEDPEFEDKVALLLLGEWEELGLNVDMSEELKTAILDALDFIDFLGDEIAKIKPYDKGIVVGAVIFEFFPWSKTLSMTGRLLKVTKRAEKFKKLGVSEAAMARWTQRVNLCEQEGWCFTGDTPVKTAFGSCRIDRIKVGDYVCSRNEDTRQTSYRRVMAVSCSTPETLWKLTYRARSSVSGDDGIGELSASGNHPIWSSDARAFVELSSLRSGERLSTCSNDPAEVVSVAKIRSGERTLLYNLTVDGFHTYFAGAHGVWAHNTATRPCKTLYATALRFVGRGMPRKGGGRLRNPTEYQALIHTFNLKIPVRTKVTDLTADTVKETFAIYTKRVHPGQKFWTPFRHLPHDQYLKLPDVPFDVQLHHLWPQRYILNAANYKIGTAIEVPRALHTKTGLGFDWHFDDFMLRRLRKDHGLDWPGGADIKGNPNDWEEAKKAAIAFFKGRRLDSPNDATRLGLIRECYQERFLLDIPKIRTDGVFP